MPEQTPPPPVQVTTIEHRVDFAVDAMADYSRPDPAQPTEPTATVAGPDTAPRGAQQL